MRYLKVTVRDRDVEVKVLPSSNLMQVLMRAKVSPYAPVMGMQWLGNMANCHGKGLCGKCAVRVVDNPAGLTDRTPKETTLLGATSPQARLSCQAQICGDVTVDVRKTGLASAAALLDEADVARVNHDKIIGAAG